MKKLISVVLCVLVFTSILSVSAYAEKRFLLHSKGEEGVLYPSGVWAKTTVDGGYFYYPVNSKFKLYDDLDSNDTVGLVTIYDERGNWSEYTYVSVDNLYFFPDHVRIAESGA